MNATFKYALSAVVIPASLMGSAHAAVLASTDFDGRVLSPSNTATSTSLNWVTNGLEDPGDMAALNAADAAQSLFDGNALTRDIFAPALNTGNGNTFWTTTINLTVASGAIVTLESVVFDYLAINGSQALNVNRKSDFTVTLFNPSAVAVDSVDIIDALSGTTAVPTIPTLTATFAAPIDLSLPGTYTLQIKGGDYLGTGETGNHTAIDNLVLNGTSTAIPEPSSLALLGLGALTALSRRRR